MGKEPQWVCKGFSEPSAEPVPVFLSRPRGRVRGWGLGGWKRGAGRVWERGPSRHRRGRGRRPPDSGAAQVPPMAFAGLCGLSKPLSGFQT